MVVEVGTLSRRYKWLGRFPMVHVASADEITLVASRRSWFTNLIFTEVEASLEPYRWPRAQTR